MKNFSFKCGLLFLVFACYFLPVQAQEVEPNWILIQEIDGVSYYYSSSLCDEKDVFFLKIENTTSLVKDLLVQIEVSESGKQNSIGKINATLTNQGIQKGDCSMLSNPSLQLVLNDDYQSPTFTITKIQ